MKSSTLSFICFRCEECQRHFTQKIHLRKHLEKHHPEIDFDYAMKDSCETLIKVEEIVGDGTKNVIYEEYELVDEADSEKEVKHD